MMKKPQLSFSSIIHDAPEFEDAGDLNAIMYRPDTIQSWKDFEDADGYVINLGGDLLLYLSKERPDKNP